MDACIRCGKKTPDIHTCTPNASVGLGRKEGLSIARELVLKRGENKSFVINGFCVLLARELLNLIEKEG